jgi:hypothetical protein
MSSTYSTRKRLEKQTPSENNNAWGGYLNSNMIDLVDECFGVVCVNMTGAGDLTLSTNNGASDEGRRSQIILTGVPTSNVRLFVPAQQSYYLVRNKMTGTKKVTITNAGGVNGVDFSGSGSGAEQGVVISDGTNVREVARTVSIGGFATLTSTIIGVVSDATTDTTGGAAADFLLFLDASETGALNKVTTQKFLDNSHAMLAAKTSVGTTDQIAVFDAPTSTVQFSTVPQVLQVTNSLTAKTTPVTADVFPLMDSAASNAAKKVTYGNLATALIGTLAAPQASMETGTSNILVVTPGSQKWHPGHPKAWTNFNGQGTIAQRVNFGVSSLTDNATGDYSVTKTTAFSTADFSFSMQSGWGVGNAFTTEQQGGAVNTTTTLRFNTYQINNSTIDPLLVCAQMWGDE